MAIALSLQSPSRRTPGLGASCLIALALGLTGCSGSDGSGAKAGGFSIAATPDSLQVPAGGSGYVVVTVTRRNGFTGAVTVSMTGQPAGVVASGTIPDGAAMAHIEVAVDGAVNPQVWNGLALDGHAGALSSSTAFALTVAAPLPPTSLSADLGNAPGGSQASGGLSNTFLFMEPVGQGATHNGSGSLDNRAGFLPGAGLSHP